MSYAYDNILPLSERRFILQHDGDFVERIESSDTATVKVHFVFTPDREKAKHFSFDDLHKGAVHTEFVKGYTRGKMLRVL